MNKFVILALVVAFVACKHQDNKQVEIERLTSAFKQFLTQNNHKQAPRGDTNPNHRCTDSAPCGQGRYCSQWGWCQWSKQPANDVNGNHTCSNQDDTQCGQNRWCSQWGWCNWRPQPAQDQNDDHTCTNQDDTQCATGRYCSEWGWCNSRPRPGQAQRRH